MSKGVHLQPFRERVGDAAQQDQHQEWDRPFKALDAEPIKDSQYRDVKRQRVSKGGERRSRTVQAEGEPLAQEVFRRRENRAQCSGKKAHREGPCFPYSVRWDFYLAATELATPFGL